MARQTVNGIEIDTDYIHPPIPVRHFDWQAIEADYDLDRPIGTGATEQAAINDLLEKLEAA